jgi:hypothetical protein
MQYPCFGTHLASTGGYQLIGLNTIHLFASLILRTLEQAILHSFSNEPITGKGGARIFNTSQSQQLHSEKNTASKERVTSHSCGKGLRFLMILFSPK